MATARQGSGFHLHFHDDHVTDIKATKNTCDDGLQFHSTTIIKRLLLVAIQYEVYETIMGVS